MGYYVNTPSQWFHILWFCLQYVQYSKGHYWGENMLKYSERACKYVVKIPTDNLFRIPFASGCWSIIIVIRVCLFSLNIAILMKRVHAFKFHIFVRTYTCSFTLGLGILTLCDETKRHERVNIPTAGVRMEVWIDRILSGDGVRVRTAIWTEAMFTDS